MSLELLNLIVISLLPGIELRGGIPYGLSAGLDPLLVFTVSVLTNLLIIPVTHTAMKFIVPLIRKKIGFVDAFLEKTRRKGKPYIDTYGFLGLTVFVAIPFPGSGAYTGTILAYLLGFKKRDSYPAISLGVLIAASLITAASLGILNSIAML